MTELAHNTEFNVLVNVILQGRLSAPIYMHQFMCTNLCAPIYVHQLMCTNLCTL